MLKKHGKLRVTYNRTGNAGHRVGEPEKNNMSAGSTEYRYL
jgi:hypothetical protein